MRNRILFFLAASLVASPAFAHPMFMQNGINCVGGMQENVSINVNFNIRAESFADAKKKFEQKIQQVNDFAKQQNIGKFELQSMNYNINAQVTYDGGMPEPGYQLNGNASYMVDSSDNAMKLGEFLTQQKFQVSMNANRNRNPMCVETPAETPAAGANVAVPATGVIAHPTITPPTAPASPAPVRGDK